MVKIKPFFPHKSYRKHRNLTQIDTRMYTTNQTSFKYRSAEGDSPLPGLAEVPRNSSAYRECRGRQPSAGV